MKICLAFIGSALSSVLFVSTPFAADAGFTKLDANGDQRISEQEHATGAKAMFDAMDANRDRKVSAAEMDAAQRPAAAGQSAAPAMTSAEKIKVVDSNGDGVLTAAEHAAGSRKMFVAMDTDKDGFLSVAEYETGHAKLMKPASR